MCVLVEVNDVLCVSGKRTKEITKLIICPVTKQRSVIYLKGTV